MLLKNNKSIKEKAFKNKIYCGIRLELDLLIKTQDFLKSNFLVLSLKIVKKQRAYLEPCRCILNLIPQQKEPELLGEMAATKSTVRNVQSKTEASQSARKQVCA